MEYSLTTGFFASCSEECLNPYSNGILSDLDEYRKQVEKMES